MRFHQTPETDSCFSALSPSLSLWEVLETCLLAVLEMLS